MVGEGGGESNEMKVELSSSMRHRGRSRGSPPLLSLSAFVAMVGPQRTQPVPQGHCALCPVPKLLSQCPHSAEGRAFINAELRRLGHSVPQRLPTPTSYAPPITPPRFGNGLFSPGYGHSQSSYSQLAPASSPIGGGPFLSPPLAGGSAPSPTPTPDNADNNESDSETTPSAGNKKRVRISNTNNIHGHIEGAMRGKEVFAWPRTRALPAARTKQADASKRFTRCVQDIIGRCERAATETGCWLQISAQHPFASGAFIHYSSPRLRKEGKSDIVRLTNEFQTMYSGLMAARHRESRDMYGRMVAAETTEKEAREALSASRAAEREATDRLRERENELELLKNQLVIARAAAKGK
ncbi:hypothetical protein MKEN_00325500 [Mycena kentingensis (nom. inval.)]|nr:hypothetical protein MKEN_00325500 [Mycena kentingensis (nom. inval.)]